MNEEFEIVVGLEVHAQLLTKSKLFSGDSTAFGSEPNTQVSPVSLGHPGSLPKLNRKAIEFAVKMGLACHCEIEKENYFARKNYFYPDLPKGYQLSQHTTPVCKGGYITIKTGENEKKIRLNRIHLEEDAGKSLHDIDSENSSIDLNRAGTPLIEIVTEPDLRSGEEAHAFLSELRKLVRYLDICDGNMEQGSLRCDANISVRKKNDKNLGTKVEVKNLNSMRHVKKAIEFEAERMINLVRKGEVILQETRSFDANTGSSFSTREKEDADDYRYFADPDLTKFVLTDEFVSAVENTIPELAADKVGKYTSVYKLSAYDAVVISEDKQFANYFEELLSFTPNAKSAANWMLGPVKSWLNENNAEIRQFPLKAGKLSVLIDMVNCGELSFSIASTRLLHLLLQQTEADPRELAQEKNLLQESDAAEIGKLIEQVLNKFPAKVIEYRKGKKGLIGLFVGEVIKLSGGKADPKITNDILVEKLKS